MVYMVPSLKTVLWNRWSWVTVAGQGHLGSIMAEWGFKYGSPRVKSQTTTPSLLSTQTHFAWFPLCSVVCLCVVIFQYPSLPECYQGSSCDMLQSFPCHKSTLQLVDVPHGPELFPWQHVCICFRWLLPSKELSFYPSCALVKYGFLRCKQKSLVC